MPFAIAAPFLNADLAHDRSCRVAVVGRWNDPQKDAPMVAEVLRRFLHHEPRCEAVVIGEHDPCLAELCEAHPRASHRGLIPYHALAAELARCRVLFSASRFEGCPHSALEAMAVGNTLVGPPIPCFESWARQEDFGTVAKRRTAKSLLTALSAEMGRWQRGDRDAGAIASVWRQRLAPAEICRQMLRVDGVPGEGAGHEAKAR